MIAQEEYLVIHRLSTLDYSISQIARELGLDRKTVPTHPPAPHSKRVCQQPHWVRDAGCRARIRRHHGWMGGVRRIGEGGVPAPAQGHQRQRQDCRDTPPPRPPGRVPSEALVAGKPSRSGGAGAARLLPG
jgi:hypothetical protein